MAMACAGALGAVCAAPLRVPPLTVNSNETEANWVGVRPTGTSSPWIQVASRTPASITLPLADHDAAPAAQYDIRVESRGWLLRYGATREGYRPGFDLDHIDFHLRYEGLNPLAIAAAAALFLIPTAGWLVTRQRKRRVEIALKRVEREKEVMATTKVSDRALPQMLGRTLTTTHGRRFEVLRLVGNGSMGAVFEAVSHDRTDEKTESWAIKIPFREAVVRSDTHRRFLREAEICTGLRHAGLVHVLDWGTLVLDDDPEVKQWPFLVMEMMGGTTLGDVLDREGAQGLPLDRVIAWSREIALALQQMHTQSIVHRDLKPDNIFVTPTGHLKIGDFGLSGHVDRHSVTASGETFGTPLYMSPEHLEAQSMTQASDIYSLGVITYEMACGNPPFVADTAIAVLNRMLTGKAVPLAKKRSEIPPELNELVSDMTERSPEKRPAMEEILARLSRAARNEPPSHPDVAARETSGPHE